MANELESATSTIMALVREQMTMMQQSFTDALAQQRAILEAQHQQTTTDTPLKLARLAMECLV